MILVQKKSPESSGTFTLFIFISNNVSVRLLQIKKEVKRISVICYHLFYVVGVKFDLCIFCHKSFFDYKNTAFIKTKA